MEYVQALYQHGFLYGTVQIENAAFGCTRERRSSADEA